MMSHFSLVVFQRRQSNLLAKTKAIVRGAGFTDCAHQFYQINSMTLVNTDTNLIYGAVPVVFE